MLETDFLNTQYTFLNKYCLKIQLNLQLRIIIGPTASTITWKKLKFSKIVQNSKKIS